MPRLTHLIYASTASPSFNADDLPYLLDRARRDNAAVGVTGMLLYADRSFFQILEGMDDVVEALFARIAHDRRHERVVRIISEPIAQRSFAEWTMGYADAQRNEVTAITGLNDFFAGGSCLANLDQGRARKVLAAFRDGRWRSRLTGLDESAAGLQRRL